MNNDHPWPVSLRDAPRVFFGCGASLNVFPVYMHKWTSRPSQAIFVLIDSIKVEYVVHLVHLERTWTMSSYLVCMRQAAPLRLRPQAVQIYCIPVVSQLLDFRWSACVWYIHHHTSHSFESALVFLNVGSRTYLLRIYFCDIGLQSHPAVN